MAEESEKPATGNIVSHGHLFAISDPCRVWAENYTTARACAVISVTWSCGICGSRPDMYVCSCRGVTDRSIRNAINSGADTVEEIGRTCGAGTRCGGCWPVIDELVAGAERVGPYLTLLRGISFERENIRWAERALTIIGRRLPVQA